MPARWARGTCSVGVGEKRYGIGLLAVFELIGHAEYYDGGLNEVGEDFGGDETGGGAI